MIGLTDSTGIKRQFGELADRLVVNGNTPGLRMWVQEWEKITNRDEDQLAIFRLRLAEMEDIEREHGGWSLSVFTDTKSRKVKKIEGAVPLSTRKERASALLAQKGSEWWQHAHRPSLA